MSGAAKDHHSRGPRHVSLALTLLGLGACTAGLDASGGADAGRADGGNPVDAPPGGDASAELDGGTRRDGGENDGGVMALADDGGEGDAAVVADADPSFVYLSELDWSATKRVRNGPHRDASGWAPHDDPPRGGYKPIEINGRVYERGVSWFPHWRRSHVEWRLGGAFQRLAMTVRFDDEKRGHYEWGVVDRDTGEFLRLERPPGGYRAAESDTRFRIGAGGRVTIYGDGRELHTTRELYAYGPAAEVSVDVRGVDRLRIELNPSHSEQSDAPHRNGLSSTPARVRHCAWHDLIDLADARLLR